MAHLDLGERDRTRRLPSESALIDLALLLEREARECLAQPFSVNLDELGRLFAEHAQEIANDERLAALGAFQNLLVAVEDVPLLVNLQLEKLARGRFKK